MAAVKRQGPESARRRPDKLSPEEIFDNIDDLTDRSWFIIILPAFDSDKINMKLKEKGIIREMGETTLTAMRDDGCHLLCFLYSFNH